MKRELNVYEGSENGTADRGRNAEGLEKWSWEEKRVEVGLNVS